MTADEQRAIKEDIREVLETHVTYIRGDISELRGDIRQVRECAQKNANTISGIKRDAAGMGTLGGGVVAGVIAAAKAFFGSGQ